MTTRDDQGIFHSLNPSARKPLEAFRELTAIQRLAVPTVVRKTPCLLIAPTASGKTEAALVPLVHLAEEEGWKGSPRILWLAPTRALVNDLHRRLTLAVQGHLVVGRRTADHRDTNAELLVTTPESVDSMLVRGGSKRGHLLKHVQAIVLDELHLLADGPRGSQLNVLLGRLERLTGRPVMSLGLSATVWDAPQLACRFLGRDAVVLSAGAGRALSIHDKGDGWPETSPGIVDPLVDRMWRVDRAAGSVDLADRLLDLRRESKLKSLVFVSSRARCDRVSADLRPLLGGRSPVQVVAHHGSLSKEERERAERVLTEADESVAVATATLEIGIDIGDITTVVLDGPPGSVSSLLQRVGRANRRGGTTHVLPLAGNSIEACILASMLRAARNGDLDHSQPPRHYSVAIQQAASTLKQDGRSRVPRREFVALLEREFGTVAPTIVAGLETGEWLEDREGQLLAPSDALSEIMDSDFRLHGNIGSVGGVVPVVDDVTGEPIAWVPRQSVAKAVQLAGRVFEAELTQDAIRVRERRQSANPETFRYATRRAPMMRTALRHLALGLGLPENALVARSGMWIHFGGALYAAMLRLLGVPGGALSSETDPRSANVEGLLDAARRGWQDLETLFGFGPFQRRLPDELRQASVVDSLPAIPFRQWIESLEETELSEEQARLLFGA